jgi:hypothetical protein
MDMTDSPDGQGEAKEAVTIEEIRDMAIIAALAELRAIDPAKVAAWATGCLAQFQREGRPMDRASLLKQVARFKDALHAMKKHPATSGHQAGDPGAAVRQQ